MAYPHYPDWREERVVIPTLLPQTKVDDCEAMLRAYRAELGVPVILSDAILAAMRSEGMDVGALLAKGVIAPYPRLSVSAKDSK